MRGGSFSLGWELAVLARNPPYAHTKDHPDLAMLPLDGS